MTDRAIRVLATLAILLWFACEHTEPSTVEPDRIDTELRTAPAPPTPAPRAPAPVELTEPAPPALPPEPVQPIKAVERASTPALQTHAAVAIPRELDTSAPAEHACCRHCHKGKACGNSCINKQLQCHQPRGCACDD